MELELELKIMELELELNWKNGIDPNPDTWHSHHAGSGVGCVMYTYISYIYYFLPLFTVSCMKQVIILFFYSLITFSYTKCFVHSYTIDVVFTLSY